MLPEIKRIKASFKRLCKTPVFLFKEPDENLSKNALILLPFEPNRLHCGLSGILTFKSKTENQIEISNIFNEIDSYIENLKKNNFSFLENKSIEPENYLLGKDQCSRLLALARSLKKEENFAGIYSSANHIQRVENISATLNEFCKLESKTIESKLGLLPPGQAVKIVENLEMIKDTSWTIDKEILLNIKKIQKLSTGKTDSLSALFYRKINTVLNSINILEVRGRDSAGISVFVTLDQLSFNEFKQLLNENSLDEIFLSRKNIKDLVNYKISENKNPETGNITLAFTYKFAAEIGALGDNISFIRNQIKNDFILRTISSIKSENISVGAHTRWASVGEISQFNCHPVDNRTTDITKNSSHLIHVSLNGDIDNYKALKDEFENKIDKIPENISSDTKIIPLQVSKYYYEGNTIEESFRLAVSDFKGSHAILMQTDLCPGKLFLAQKGSGQAIFVGISEDSYTIASEVYGFVERTQEYYKLEGEKLNGQIVVLDENEKNSIKGITSYTYKGEPVEINQKDIQHTEITSRDVDRQDFEHFFLKEVNEAPRSVRRTLQGRWEIIDKTREIKKVSFGESIFPEALRNDLKNQKIKRIYFIGQGTAGVAANASSFLVSRYLENQGIFVSALKASELSGFILDEKNKNSMEDSLVVAISQSGTTTDTNKSIDMAKACGAKTLAIVNRRDSDITFKVDGVLYTSTGRDIEMSVASTKAFYSQVTAGALLGLFLCDLLKTKNDEFISEEIDLLKRLPEDMMKILENREQIKEAAEKTASEKIYWATVGSGPNKTAADELRIKLSELCYRTISTDFVEDKKHIDLSSEPLILVCAAGTREAVLSDIIKDNAIFKAHKSTTVVFADEDDNRFDKDSDALIKIPKTGEHLSPVLVTLAGHLWGYYAASAINEDSKFFFKHRKKIKDSIESLKAQNKELFEIVLEKEFKENIACFYREIRQLQQAKNFFAILPANFMSDLLLTLNYLYGRLNPSEFELDFSVKGTPANMVTKLFNMLSTATDLLARPIDAIKHQAKTVTVGTSRISEKFEGVVFDFIAENKISTDQITPLNLLVIKNLQGVIDSVKGSVLYRIKDLNLLGEPTDNTRISIVWKKGILENIPSRIEKDSSLKGTKKIIVREGNVFIGRGQKDNRSLLIVPVTSDEKSEQKQKIEFLLSLDIGFKKEIPLYVKAKALGGKLERIKNNVQENNITWNDSFLDILKPEELFGLSYEKIVEKIVTNKQLN